MSTYVPVKHEYLWATLCDSLPRYLVPNCQKEKFKFRDFIGGGKMHAMLLGSGLLSLSLSGK